MKCSLCDNPALARGWCSKHYQRWLNNGDPLQARQKRNDGQGTIRKDGRVVIAKKFEHVRIAESALGKRLPECAQVHHVDENPKNNSPDNLVICPNDAYHKLLHRRANALAASGNADYVRCAYCKQYDSQDSMQLHSGNSYTHRSCYTAYKRNLRACPA